jgi:hypothetical protein
MSIFYTGINDLFQPLLVFGILFALLQFSVSQISSQRQTRLGRFLIALSESSQLPLFIFVSILGLYIMIKLFMTAGGWISTICNISETIFRQQIPPINYQIGIGASILFPVFLSILIIAIVKFIKQHRRGKKSTNSEDI